MEHSYAAIPPNLRRGRIHDVCGISAPVFAVMHAARMSGPVLWIESTRQDDTLCPQGLASFFNPARLTLVRTASPKETLWAMEEALRAAPAYVVAALPEAAALTQSRRLQLAAEAGGSTGVCLIPDAAVNNAAETRWRITPLPAEPESTLQRFELIKNKKGILGSWEISWNAAANRMHVVAVSGGRASPADGEALRPCPTLRCSRDAEKRLAALLAERGGGNGRFEPGDATRGCAGTVS